MVQMNRLDELKDDLPEEAFRRVPSEHVRTYYSVSALDEDLAATNGSGRKRHPYLFQVQVDRPIVRYEMVKGARLSWRWWLVHMAVLSSRPVR